MVKGADVSEDRCGLIDELEDTLNAAAAGDESAFEKLHSAYDRFVALQIRKVLVETHGDAVNDVAQEVWQVVHRDLPAYDPLIASFTRWLAVICVRRALNHRRREHVRDEAVRRYRSLSDAGRPTASDNPLSRVESDELIGAVRECAALLRGREKAIFAAVRLMAANIATVAARHGITAGRVRGALCEANQKVLDCLRRKGLA